MSYFRFVWTDLSTFDMGKARSDYAALFGWSFAGDDAYDFATLNGEAVAAVFPMPQNLAAIDMPSFWMSYVRVPDLEASVAAARRHAGAIIEIDPMPFDETARIALVRDPSGAGFTMYEGPDITPEAGGPGCVCARYHHLPDVGTVADFYGDLFGWSFEQVGDAPWPVYDIRHRDGTVVAQAEEVPEAVRGRFRYWMPCFAVLSTAAAVKASGTAPIDLSGGRKLVSDRQGAHFMIRD